MNVLKGKSPTPVVVAVIMILAVVGVGFVVTRWQSAQQPEPL